MSVSVPIKQKDKFGFPKSIPEIQPKEELAQNDIEFLRRIGDDGRFVNRTASLNGIGDVVQFIPIQGDTFYLLEAVATSPVAANKNVALAVTIGGIQSNIKAAFLAGETSEDLTIKGFALIGNGTDSIEINNSTGSNVTATLFGYTEQSRTLSSRGNVNLS